jgi:hypothetical protein
MATHGRATLAHGRAKRDGGLSEAARCIEIENCGFSTAIHDSVMTTYFVAMTPHVVAIGTHRVATMVHGCAAAATNPQIEKLSHWIRATKLTLPVLFPAT